MRAQGEFNMGVWSAEEHKKFLLALKDFTTWKEVARSVGTRSITQCRSHDQKLKKKELNRMQGRGRPSRMEHRLLSDDDNEASTPTSPTGVDESEQASASEESDPHMVKDPVAWLKKDTPELTAALTKTEEMLSTVDGRYITLNPDIPSSDGVLFNEENDDIELWNDFFEF